MNNIQTHLATFEPATEGQKTLAADANREFSRLIELRRMRLKSVTGGLPASYMGRPLVRRLSQCRSDLVFSHEEPEHAFLDDRDVRFPSRL